MQDIIVIGSGVAGMTAALYALRNGKKVLIIEGNSIGGQIANSPRVENYPSIESISGETLGSNMFDQITNLGVEFEFDTIEDIKKEGNGFKVVGEYGKYEAKSVIVANGVKHRHLKLNKEDKFIGKGVYYCALCDGPFYKGKEVTVIGDGNTALQYALMLSDICSKVNLVIMFDKFFGDENLVKAVEKRGNINIIKNSKTVELIGDTELEKVKFEKQNGETFLLNAPLFVAIGQVPNNEKFKHLANLDEYGFFDSAEDCKTKTDGLFVAGDTRKKAVRQVATAICDGAVAGTNAVNYLNSLAGED